MSTVFSVLVSVCFVNYIIREFFCVTGACVPVFSVFQWMGVDMIFKVGGGGGWAW